MNLIKTGVCFYAAAMVSAFAFRADAVVSLDDRVLTIDSGGTLSEILSGDYAAYYTALKTNDGTITNVVLTGSSKITVKLTEDLEYTGSWNLANAKVEIGDTGTAADPTWPMGKGTGESATIVLTSSKSQIYVNTGCGNARISAPLHIAGNSPDDTKVIYLNGHNTTGQACIRFDGLVTIDTACCFHFQSGKATMYMYGGMDAPSGTVRTVGANGNWYVYNNPIALGTVMLNFVYLRLYTAGNAIGHFNSTGGGKIVLYEDGALSGAVMRISNFTSTGDFFDLNGHSAEVSFSSDDIKSGYIGNGNITKTSNPATLYVSNDVDVTLGCQISGNLDIVKKGSGKLSINRENTLIGKITLTDGTVATGTSAVMTAVSGVEFSGGRLEMASDKTFSVALDVDVADSSVANQILLPAGKSISIARMTIDGEIANLGVYGSSSSSAENKLDVFDPASDGTVCTTVGDEFLQITVSSGTVSISDAISAEDLAKLNANGYTTVIKKGSGTLLLDEPLDFTGSWLLVNGGTHVATPEYAFGKGTGVSSGIFLQHTNKAYIQFMATNAVVSNPITVYAPLNPNAQTSAIRLRADRVSCTLTGLLSCPYGTLSFFFPKGCVFYTRGGVDAMDGGILNAGASEHWWVYDVPINVSVLNLSFEQIHLAVPGNNIQTLRYDLGYHMTLEVDDAFVNRPQLNMNYTNATISKVSWGTFDLKGHDTAVSIVTNRLDGYLITSSSNPATLDLEVSVPATTNYSIIVDGKLSIKKTGAGAFVCTQSPSATGSLEISAGEMEFSEGVDFIGCTNLVLSGGRIVTKKSNAIGTGMALFSVTDASASDVISVADGTFLTFAGCCMVGGENLGTGYFGGALSPSYATRSAIFDPARSGYVLFNNDLTISVSKDETVSIADALSAEELAALNADKYTRVIVTGPGTLLLDQALEYSGRWEIMAGVVKATAPVNAFGKRNLNGMPDDVVVFNGVENTGVVVLGVSGQETVIEKPISVTAYPGNGANGRSDVKVYGTVRLQQTLTINTHTYVIIFENIGKLYCEAGVTNVNGTIGMNAADGNWYLGRSKLNVYSPIWATIHWQESGNQVNTLKLHDSCSCQIKADDVFVEPLPNFHMEATFTGTPKLHLNGHDVSVGNINLKGETVQTQDYAKGSSVIDSDEPAVFSFRQTSVSTNYDVHVKGAVSLTKGGDASYTFATNILSTGNLTVTGGVFELAENCTWAGCTNVVVDGEGAVVKLNSSDPFYRKAAWRIADGGKVDIQGASTVVRTGVLFFDDEMEVSVECGTWGSSSSPATFKDDTRFSGTGVLLVTRRIGAGLTILIK